MSQSTSARVLLVANRTAATPGLIDAVRRRAHAGQCSFTLLIPQLPGEAEFGEEEARKTLELAIPLLEEAAGGPVSGLMELPTRYWRSNGRSFTSTSTRRSSRRFPSGCRTG